MSIYSSPKEKGDATRLPRYPEELSSLTRVELEQARANSSRTRANSSRTRASLFVSSAFRHTCFPKTETAVMFFSSLVFSYPSMIFSFWKILRFTSQPAWRLFCDHLNILISFCALSLNVVSLFWTLYKKFAFSICSFSSFLLYRLGNEKL